MTEAGQPATETTRVAPVTRSSAMLAVKRLVQAGCLLLVAHRLLVYRIATWVLGRDRAFSGASESISRIPGTRGVFVRQAFYRHTLSRCGQDVYFGWLSVFSTPQASVGDRVYIGRRCSIGFADIGARTLLADGVQILSGARQHSPDASTRNRHPQEYSRVEVGSDCWLGTNTVAMASVGSGSTIGAGAVVTRPIPEDVIAVGVPAQVARSAL